MLEYLFSVFFKFGLVSTDKQSPPLYNYFYFYKKVIPNEGCPECACQYVFGIKASLEYSVSWNNQWLIIICVVCEDLRCILFLNDCGKPSCVRTYYYCTYLVSKNCFKFVNSPLSYSLKYLESRRKIPGDRQDISAPHPTIKTNYFETNYDVIYK